MEITFNTKESRGGKRGLSREMFLPWAGWFPHPELDRDIEPHPWGVTDEVKQLLAKLPPVPAGLKFTIPNGISLAEFRRYPVNCKESVLEVLQAQVLREAMLAAATAPDRKALASRKPLDGIYAFIWRFARYYSGQASDVPVTAFWDLDDGITRLTGVRGAATEEV